MTDFKIRNQVAIVGTGFSEVGRPSSRTLAALTVEACRRAVEDAGLTFKDIDGLATMPMYPTAAGGEEGIETVPTDFTARMFNMKQVTWFGHSILKGMIGSAMVSAIDAIAAGACTTVLVWRGVHYTPGRRATFTAATAAGDAQFLAPYGFGGGGIGYTMCNSRWSHLYGITREKMGAYIVSNRANAAKNPNAIFYRKPITLADYMNDPVIFDPYSRLDFDMPVDGAGAWILTTADRARHLRNKPAYVTAYAQTGFEFENSVFERYEQFVDQAGWCAKVFWDRARLEPKDIDCAVIHDCISSWPPMWLEVLGLCKPGEGLDLIASGYPVNRMGGSLGMGRLHGSPTYIEAARQVQGLAGPNQAPNIRTAITYVGSPISGGALMMLSNDATI